MRSSGRFLIAGIAGAALLGAAGAALASHGKEGLWSVTMTMGGNTAMPDMSKLPPDVQARMKAMGVSAHGNSMTVQHCMTAEEVATDQPRIDPQSAKTCKMSNEKMSGHTMSADLVCSGDFTGTGHMEFNYDGDTHYTGEMKMSGTSKDGTPIQHDQKFDGTWVSADCGGVTH
jgi:hypothetical protein